MADPTGTAPAGTPATDPAVTATPATTTTTTTAPPATTTPPAADPTVTTTPPTTTAATSTGEPTTKVDPNDPVVKAKDTDWAAIRTKIANGDEKLEKRLGRYSSVESLAEALIQAQNKIASGDLKSVLPKDAKPEEVARWREENGIPAKAEDYDLTMPDGLVIGDEDKPIVADFTKVAHELNMTPAQVQKSVAWYMALQEEQIDAQAEADEKAKEDGLAVLAETWGSETKQNKQLILNLVGSMPEGVGDLLLGGRLGDGTPIGSSPAMLRWLADTSRALNPAATVVPGAGSNAAEAIDRELADLTKLMGISDSEYWKGPLAEKKQARYRQLLEVQQKIK